jgi:long-chain acyl-CoA synthetase
VNLASTVIGPTIRHDPDHIAVRLDDVALSFAALDVASAHLAGLLAERGVRRGDRVGVMLPNIPHFPVCYYGALRAGAVVVPMNVLLKRREVAYYLSDSGAKLLFAWEGFAEEATAGAKQAGAECIVVELTGFAPTRTPRCCCTRQARPASPRAPSSPTPT